MRTAWLRNATGRTSCRRRIEENAMRSGWVASVARKPNCDSSGRNSSSVPVALRPSRYTTRHSLLWLPLPVNS